MPAAWVLLLVTGNLSGGILHKHSTSDARQDLSVQLLRLTGPGDLVVLPLDRLWLCVTYHHPEIRCLGLEPGGPWVAAARESARKLREGHRVLAAADVLPRLAGLVEAELPPGSRLESRPLFEYADSETPLDRRQLLELGLAGPP